jgi:sterol desaturase/sphingolipid hydroxylase (fatty acid hydroxylase superfamily)
VSESIPYRERYRTEVMPRRYSGILHACTTFALGFAGIAWAVHGLSHIQPLEWLAVPTTFVFGNLTEYQFHRFPMHHQRRYARFAYRRHMQHHSFYTMDSMAAESSRDYHIVLFPPWALLLVMGLNVAPIAFVLHLLFPPNVALLFATTAIAYFLNYELLHLSYHLPPDAWLRRIPGIKRLAKQHTLHHDPAQMAQLNFNITYPIADRLFGTLKR